MNGPKKSKALAILFAGISLGIFFWGFEMILNDKEPIWLIHLDLLSIGSWAGFLWSVTRQ